MNSRKNLPKIFLQIVIVVLFSLVVGATYNIFSKEGITLVGSWSNKALSDSLIVPYSYDEQDPPAITLSQAMTFFQSHNTVFLDARLELDYKIGHIQGALNLPFEDFEIYYPRIKPLLPEDKNIIIYCDGTECESSLFLARLLQEKGYMNLKIFFGGWTEWCRAGLPVEKSR